MGRQSSWNGHSFAAPRTAVSQQVGMRNSGVANPSSTLSSVPASPLSEAEAASLAYQYSEEMVARDLYSYFATLYPDAVFKSIAASEQTHMDAVKALLDRYSVTVPTGYGELQSTFDALKSAGETSRQAALEVGLKVEMLDIEDIKKAIESTDNDDLKLVFANIGGASYNHLRGFSKALSANGYAPSVDISEYLSATEIASRGSLQYKLSETLADEGISVPDKGGMHQGNGKSGQNGMKRDGGSMGGYRNANR